MLGFISVKALFTLFNSCVLHGMCVCGEGVKGEVISFCL